MKLSISWLKDYVDIKTSPEALAHRLTMAGLEVEKIFHVGDDTVMEIEITPNRPDCLNMIGLAREVSAIFNNTLRYPKGKKIVFPKATCDIKILDKEGCSRYIGTVIKDVQIKPAVVELQKKIQAIGLRPINNVVDITNFCLMETGQPLHAFDYDKLRGGKIIVRRARKGEHLTTLDGVSRTLDPSILVIADVERPVAIAGVMGGEGTEVTEGTKNILLESAYFDPVLIRRGARALGLPTDSSYRFERGVDMAMVEKGSNRAVSLIQQFAGGRIHQYKDLFTVKHKTAKKKMTINTAQINSLLGASLTPARCKTILKKLDFQVSVKDRKSLTVIPPTFRGDIARIEDIIEEVARIVGYDHLPVSLPSIKISSIPTDDQRPLKQALRETLLGQGFHEAITFALTSQANLEKTRILDGKTVRVKNPLTQEQEMMRPGMLPSLLHTLRLNLHRGQKDIRLFEIGKIYTPGQERDTLAIIMTGKRFADWRILKKEEVDFYDMKGLLARLTERMGGDNIYFQLHDETVFTPGQGGQLFIEKQEGKKKDLSVGIMGKVHPEIIENWEMKEENVFFTQIDLETLFKDGRKNRQYQPVCEYPAMTRDISLAVKKEVSFQQVKEVVWQRGSEFLTSVKFAEQYLGEKIPQGHHGLIFSLVYQSLSRTLTEEEIHKIHAQVCQALREKLGAVIR